MYSTHHSLSFVNIALQLMLLNNIVTESVYIILNPFTFIATSKSSSTKASFPSLPKMK